MNFVKIKDYPKYLINPNGVILNSVTGNILKGGINNSGYLQFRLTDVHGIVKTWGLHRLLFWVFKHNFENMDGLVINHLDGNKLNNDLDNFELTTYQGNAEHAGLMQLTEKCKPIKIRNAITGEVVVYPSIIAYSRECGLSKDIISNRCHRGVERVYSDLKQYGWSDSEFPELPINRLNILMSRGNLKPVLIRNILTNEITEFDRSCEAAKYLDCSLATISKLANDSTQPIGIGFHQIVFLKDFNSWINHSNPLVNYEKTTGLRCVVVTDKDGNINTFGKAKEAAEHLDISTTSLDYRLKSKGKTKFKDGTYCAYYSDWSPLEETHVG